MTPRATSTTKKRAGGPRPAAATKSGRGTPASSWAAVRRVHFYIHDVIERDFAPVGVGHHQRRILDALDYAANRHDGEALTVARICATIPTEKSTALSALKRMKELDLVTAVSGEKSGPERGDRWRITPKGQALRSAYKRIAEVAIQEAYSDANDRQRKALFEHSRAALVNMDQEIGVVLLPDALGATRPEREPSWSSVRRTHFYINDRIFTEIMPLKVDVVERRVLDYLAFVEINGAEVGISARALNHLMLAKPTKQTLDAALKRMERLGWVIRTTTELSHRYIDASGAEQERTATVDLWRLAPIGRELRAECCRRAEEQIRKVYEKARTPANELLALAPKGTNHGFIRLTPIVARAIEDLEAL